VPRFVASSNYARGFGVQWKRHAWTQYDACTGLPLSEKRFFDETGWPRTLVGEHILEVGSGGGRFSVHAAGTGAVVASLDYSEAVDANFAINRHRQNLLIVQADVYRMPFAVAFFDRAFCFGVLQHTPDPHGAFSSIVLKVRAGGSVVSDIYEDSLLKHWLSSKYWVRPVTKRMQPERLHRLTSAWVDLMWPIASLVRRVPRVGPQLNWRLLVPDYSREGLRGPDLKRWALLDAFDMLSPAYDKPATEAAFRQWFLRAGLVNVDVCRGYNGVQGRGTVPSRAG
jgi:SAM-dependent methyltransferase